MSSIEQLDKIRPYNDPKVQLRSAHVNGRFYGYLYCTPPASVAGRGTIVLVHGFPDLSFAWRYQIPVLTSLGLTCTAIDCMGYGRSETPPSSSLKYYGFNCAVNSHSNPSSLGGHDWGGAIVYRVAQYHPTLVQALFSVCTPYFAPEKTYLPHARLVATRLPNFRYQLEYASGVMEERIRTKADIRQYLSGAFRGVGPNGEVIATAPDGMHWDVVPKLGKSPLLDDNEMDYYVQEYARNGLNGPLNWYRNREVNFEDEYQFFFGNGEKLDADPKVEQEVLFIQAIEDDALPPSMSQAMGRYIPRLTQKEVDCGHWALWEQPREINDMVRKWLEEKVFK